MSNQYQQYRSPASMQDMRKDPDVPTPKQGMPPRAMLLIGAVVGVIMVACGAFFFVGASSTQSVAPAQVAAPAQSVVSEKTAEAEARATA
ncbi:MAG: hypothetical protein EOP06_14785, partial [Proteobacteria bacterium]